MDVSLQTLMQKLFAKYRKFISIGAKLLFSILAFYFISKQVDMKNIGLHLFDNLSVSMLLMMLVFSAFNWFFAIKKWQ